jgi:uncharacterized protein YcbK (DUF882 family)
MLKQTIFQPFNRLFENKLFENELETPCMDRRRFLQAAAIATGGLAVAGAALSPALARTVRVRDRSLSIYIPRTGETIRSIYWTPSEGYIRESLNEINWALRDVRRDQARNMDPKLLDELFLLQMRLHYRKPMHILSGYRSPATNAMLRRHNRGVAKDSYHLYGKAADIRMPGRSSSEVRRAAMSLQAGGVGYYPRSRFVHVDTGPVRTWRG